jgi:intracellular sulfur oxidation DsrE/DsrF family protein
LFSSRSEPVAGLKEVKIAFDIKEGDAKLLQARLDIINETRQSLIQQGVTPHFILAFRGPSSKLVQTDLSKIKPEDRVLAEKIAARIKEMMNAPGIEGIEQCAVAARQQETNTDLVLPGIRVVGNSFISLMAYQAKGYAYINP